MPPGNRRARDPEATREAILEAARTMIARDGPEGVSLSAVAQLAGVNRGTAYQHFETREKLIQETALWVSNTMFKAVFGEPDIAIERRVERVDIADLADRLSDFAMNNPELCQIWLFQLLASPDPASDPFWSEYCGSLKRFAATELAEPDVDAEVLAVMNLAGAFLWPVWARAAARDGGAREGLAKRFANEVLRLSLHGSMRTEFFPDIAERVRSKAPSI